MVGVNGTVYGIIDVDVGFPEYPAALEASTNTVYCVPFVRPVVILADRTVLAR